MADPVINNFSCKDILRRGWALLRRTWRPMVLYSLAVVLCSSLVLVPLTTWLLYHLAGYGDVIVGNYSIHLWLLTPQGIVYLLLAGSVFIFTVILHAAGLLAIANSSRGEMLSARKTVRILLGHTHLLLRLSLRFFLLCLPFIALLAAGPGLAKLLLLSEHDINYYLTQHPTEWYLTIALSAVWVVPLVCVILFLFVRWLYALPAWLQGERPLRRALRVSWKATAGRFWPLFRVLAVWGSLWFLAAFLVELILFTAAKLLILGYADSLEGTIRILSGYFFASFILKGFMVFMGMAWGACLWLLCYYHDFRKDEFDSGPSRLPKEGRPPTRRLFKIRVAFYTAAILVIGSSALSTWFFKQEFPDERPLIIAHRAGAADAPENSLSALRKVLDEGLADMVEIDVSLTLDGELVVAHDKDLMRQAEDPRIITETNYKDLAQVDIGKWFHPDFEGERLGRLGDFLDMAKDRRPLIIEFKHGKGIDLVEKTIQAVRARKMEKEVILMSLDLEHVRKVQELAPNIRVGYFASVEMGDLTALDDVYCLGVNDRLAMPKFIRDVQEQDMVVYAWTVDDPFRMVELAEADIDGIITNDPVLVADVLDKIYDLSPPLRLLLRFQRFWGVFDDKGFL